MIRPSRMLIAGVLAMVSLGVRATETTYVFDSVSSLEHRQSQSSLSGIYFTGILVNDTTSTTLAVAPAVTDLANRCWDHLQLMMTQPGVYTLKLVYDTAGGSFGSPAFTVCALTVKP